MLVFSSFAKGNDEDLVRTEFVSVEKMKISFAVIISIIFKLVCKYVEYGNVVYKARKIEHNPLNIYLTKHTIIFISVTLFKFL